MLPNKGVRESSHGVWTERGVGFTASDGIDLVADVYHPKGIEKTPTILIRIPYTKTFINGIKTDVVGRY